ncbi:MAG: tRNA (N(6)-L-threonylcarbamoyladenosine(37)-C(2))-methylthiotransferase MtaB [Bacilli bacterium]|jgi:threonylcarbamoyladenosine tRNA methylthiotransferase MtaB
MKVAVYTLGCKVNTYESEFVLSLFKEKGYKVVSYKEEADIYIINTCTVTNQSDVKSRKIIRQLIRHKNQGIVVVMGCYAQLNKEEVEKIKGVDIIIGTKNRNKIVDYVEKFLKTKKVINAVDDLVSKKFEDMKISNFINQTRAFVKIQDGCSNYCSYCIIPYARGPLHSKKKEVVIKEVKDLVLKGFKEIVLTGINIGKYGIDLKDLTLTKLLQELVKIPKLKRLRISSIEITEITEEFLLLLEETKIIVDHFHIPLQSGSNRILKAMNRKYDVNYYYNKITEIRRIRPHVAITTDVIVGFPGETKEDFKETEQFIRKVNFASLHVFPYSKRKGTKASLMLNQVSPSIKKERALILRSLSKELEYNYRKGFLHQELEVLFEQEKDGYLIGHAANYILIKVKSSKSEIGNLKKIILNKIDDPYCLGFFLDL